jgi:chromosome segregation protein
MDMASQSEASVEEVNARLAPLQAELAALDQRVNDADAKTRQAEHHVLELESKVNAAELDLARHQNELENLRERAVDAFADDGGRGTDDGDSGQASALIGEQMSFEGRDRTFEMLDRLEVVEVLPEGINERMQQLRNQIKRLGAINVEAQQEYDTLAQRADFIIHQAEDLEQASLSLQQVIAELNDVMKATFKQTFDAIAAHFQNTFKILFGGGQAKLSMTNVDDIDATGVEIHAQPPGKRQQTLALLSGGERSLTATALLFAILRVKPTPFCVLDEVDAALDESKPARRNSS